MEKKNNKKYLIIIIILLFVFSLSFFLIPLTLSKYTETYSKNFNVAVESPKFTVSFNNNSCVTSTKPSNVTATYNAAMPGITGTPTIKTGYSLSGWYDSATGGTKYYNANGTSAKAYDKASNSTMYARCVPNTYTVEYYQGNNSTTAGSTKFTTTSTYTYDVAKTLTTYETLGGTAPSGWTFAGWSTSETGTTVNYADGASVTNLAASGTYKLYAVFKRDITFISGANKKTTTKLEQRYNPYKTTGYLTSVTTPALTAITNWTALGYRTNTSDSNKTIDASASITPTYNATATTYYGVYSRTLTIKYAAGGGTGTTANTTKTVYLNTNDTTTGSQVVTLATNGYTKTGHTFNDWKVGSTHYAEGASYNPGLAYNASSFEVTVTADWNIDDPETPTISGGNTRVYNYAGRELTCATTSTYSDDTNLYYEFGYATTTANFNAGTITWLGNPSTTKTYTVPKAAYLGTRYYTCRIYAIDNDKTSNTIQTAATTTQSFVNARVFFEVTTNGGTKVGSTRIYTAYKLPNIYSSRTGTANGSIATATKTGYTFTGWYTLPEGGDKVINADKTVNASVAGWTDENKNWLRTSASNSDTVNVLYAQFTPNTYTISFNNNGGNGGQSESLEVVYDYELPIISNTVPTKTGFTFKGWYDNSDYTQGKKYYDENGNALINYDVDGDLTLYAGWEANTYTVEYYQGNNSTTAGSTKFATTSTHIYDIESNLSSYETLGGTAPSGWTFAGWSTNQTGTTVNYTDGASVTNLAASGTYKLYAVFKRDITFISGLNKKTTTKLEQRYNPYKTTGYLTSVTSPALTAITNWTASGYRTDITPSSRSITANAVVTPTYNTTATTYYGVYTRTLTIKYAANGGTGTMSNSTKTIYLNTNNTTTSSQAVALATNTFTKTGYTFTNWLAGTTGYAEGASYNPNLAYNATAFEATVNANWEGNKYTISFNSNKGTGGQSLDVEATYGSPMPTISTTKPIRAGYTFMGWYDNEDYTLGTQYYTATGASAKSYDKTSGTTLYAGWNDDIAPVIVSVTPTSSWDIENFVDFNATDDGSGIVAYNITSNSTQPSSWIPYVSNVETSTETKYQHDAAWARVFHHNSYYGSVLFSSASSGAEAKLVNTINKYSVLGNINNYKVNNKYEFLLEYPDISTTQFNRWTQTNNPLETTNVVNDYTAVGTQSWTGNAWGGLSLSSSNTNTLIDGAIGGSWWYAIGAYKAYKGALPGANSTLASSVNLWARIDQMTTTPSNNVSRRIGGLKANQKYYVWVKDDAGNVASREVAVSKVDTTDPTTATITSTNNVATTQTATLTMGDANGVIKYYFGKSNPTNTNVTYTAVTEAPSVSKTATVNSEGTWYLSVLDVAGNRKVSNKAFYKTTLISNGATVSPETIITMSGNSFALPTPTLTGHTFNGWYTDEELTTPVTLTSGLYKPTATSSLYAKIDANNYTVSFNNNSCVTSTKPSNVTATYNAAMPGITGTPTIKTGYSLDGWYDSATGGTKYYNANGTSAKSYDKTTTSTMYARCVPNTYTIEYYQGNNTGTAGSTKFATTSSYTYDVAKTLTTYEALGGTAPSGWTFAGWSTSQTGTTVNYTDGQSVTNLASSGTYKLYAVFKRDITFISGANKKTTTKLEQRYNPYKTTGYLTSVTTPALTAITNWTALGYRTNTSDDNKTVNASTAITPTYNATALTYYGVYSRVLTIKYAAGGGTGTTANTTKTVYLNTNDTTTSSQAVTLATNGFTSTGYTFTKWLIGSTEYAEGASYNPGLAYNASSFQVTATAQWGANNYTVSFDNNSCVTSTKPGNVTATYNAAMTGITGTPTIKTGYSLDGWYDSATGGTKYYNANGTSAKSYDKAANSTMYARCVPNTYTVEYYQGNNSTTAGSTKFATTSTHTYDVAKTLTTYEALGGTAPSGWTFAGWSTSETGTTVNYADGQSVTNLAASGTYKLYAVFKRDITFISGANKKTTTKLEQRYNPYKTTGYLTSVTTPALTAITNWTALGYRTNTSDADKSVNASTAITPTYNATALTYYGVYSRTLTIKYAAGGGTGTTANTTKTVYLNTNDTTTGSQAVTLAINGFTRTGYTFTKWLAGTVEYDEGASYNPGLAYNATAFEATVTAQWGANNYTVSFDNNSCVTSTKPGNVTATYNAAMLAITGTPTIKTGYSLDGWYDSATGGTKYYNANGTSAKNYDKAANSTMYARCVPNTYTIEYYQGNNSTTAGSTKFATISTHTYDVAKALTTYEALGGTAPSGWTFAGWSTSQTGTTVNYTDGASVTNLTASGTYKLYAVFKRNITFISGANKKTTTKLEQRYNPYKTTGYLTSVTSPALTAITNWTALGYRTNTSDADKSVSESVAITPTYNTTALTYYGVYSRTLTIKYAAGGGTGTTANTTKTIYLNTNDTTTSSQAITLATNTFTKTGHTFRAWLIGSTEHAEGASYNPGLAYNATAFEVTATAKWNIDDPETPTIAGGNTAVYNYANRNLTCTTTSTYSSDTKIYYEFGYAASTTDFTSGTITWLGNPTTTKTYTVLKNDFIGSRYYTCRIYVTDSENTTGTFQTTATTTKSFVNARVYFNVAANGGTIVGGVRMYVPYGMTNVYSSRTNLSAGTISSATKTGYTFNGWYTAEEGGDKVINADKTVNASISGWTNENKQWLRTSATNNDTVNILYAQFTPNDYTVSFNNNSCVTSTKPSNVTATYNAAMPGITGTPTIKTGYSLSGWYDSATGGTKYYNANGTSAKNYDKAANSTMYARCVPNTYTVEYYQGNNTGTAGSTKFTTTSTHTYDVAKTLTTYEALGGTAPSGWTFAGWSTSETGTTVNYADGASVTNLTASGTYKLYAVFKRDITFISGLNSTTTTVLEQYYNPYKTTGYLTSVTSPALTAITSWTANGYRTDTTPAGRSIKANVSITPTYNTSATTYYGIYGRTLTIKYGANGGTGTTANTTKAVYMNTYSTTTGDQSVILSTNGYEKEGYTFNNWLDGSTEYAEGDSYNPNIAYNATFSKTLNANWTANTYKYVAVSNTELLTNGDFEEYTVVNAPTKTVDGMTHSWNNSLNGIPGDITHAYNMTNWGTGANMGVKIPEKGYHAHMRIVDGNNILRFKTNEDYDGLTDADVTNGSVTPGTLTGNRWLGVSQAIDAGKIGAGRTYLLTVDVYRVSGNNKLTGGLYYTNTAHGSTKGFYSGQMSLSPSTTGQWETLTYMFTVTDDYTNTSNPSFYLYGNSGGYGEFYVDNVRLSQVLIEDKAYDSQYTSAELPNLTRASYMFNGWYNDSNFTTNITTSNTFNTSTATFEDVSTPNTYAYVYGKWQLETYTVKFDCNGGNKPSGKLGDMTAIKGQTFTMPSDLCSRSGYDQTTDGEWKDPTGVVWKKGWSGTWNYSNGQYGIVDYSLTLKAQWTAKTYNINYVLNGGTVATANPTTYKITTSTITLNNPTRKGFDFTGWTGGGYDSPTTTATIPKGSTGNKTFTANWAGKTVTIKYNANGGSGAPSNQTYTYATSGTINLSSTKPTRTDYTFLGWSTSSTATSASYSAGQAWNKNNIPSSGTTYTLYAVWALTEVELISGSTVSTNQCSSSIGNSTYISGQTYVSASRAGYYVGAGSSSDSKTFTIDLKNYSSATITINYSFYDQSPHNKDTEWVKYETTQWKRYGREYGCWTNNDGSTSCSADYVSSGPSSKTFTITSNGTYTLQAGVTVNDHSQAIACIAVTGIKLNDPK